jgi:Plant transposon protein
MNKGKSHQDVKFTLFARTENGSSVCEVHYRGGWLLVNNGHLNWPTTVPPIKESVLCMEICWSKWIESLWKDLECTLGILKGRWRILKAGVCLHGVKVVDKIWCTCCALDNWLLEGGGLNQGWANGVASEWEGEMGTLSFDEDDDSRLTPFLRLLNVSGVSFTARTSTTSDEMDEQLHHDIQEESNSQCTLEYSNDGAVLVCSMTMQDFR